MRGSGRIQEAPVRPAAPAAPPAAPPGVLALQRWAANRPTTRLLARSTVAPTVHLS